MYIIAGLGNPTSQYQGTRHNIGFVAIDQIAADNNITLDFKKHKAICGKGTIGGEKVILAKPQTYMNLSGESIIELINFYKITNEELIIIYDDISLEPGQLRIRQKGSAGGHNGIKSIIAHLGSDVFPRIKMGVGDKPKGWDLADYVLSRFKKEEIEKIEDSILLTSKACSSMIIDGINTAMNKYNGK